MCTKRREKRCYFVHSVHAMEVPRYFQSPMNQQLMATLGVGKPELTSLRSLVRVQYRPLKNLGKNHFFHFFATLAKPAVHQNCTAQPPEGCRRCTEVLTEVVHWLNNLSIMRKPFFRNSVGCWYVKNSAGRFIKLDPDEKTAYRIAQG